MVFHLQNHRQAVIGRIFLDHIFLLHFTYRWKDPVDIPSWAPATRNATVIPPACMQGPCTSNDAQCVASVSDLIFFHNITINYKHLDVGRLSLSQYLYSITNQCYTISSDDFHSWWLLLSRWWISDVF